MTCRVIVSEGTLEGKICTTPCGKKYFSFEGIPYAKPPLGKLRFKCPQEPDSWTGVRDATKPGNRCLQLNPYASSSPVESEDCLYLNVYTPSLPAEKLEKLPVIVFVHGGRLLVGYGDYYRPDYLIRHDVILVTVNYRLHIFGFLSLNIPEVPGNAGLKDTIMAFKWVKKNIKHFNGDANNVTAGGESAGGAIVTSYLTSKMADGLCHKIICQSGNMLSDLFMLDEDHVAKARHIAKLMGKDISDVRELYEFFVAASVDDLMSAMMSAELNRPSAVVHSFLLPVVEKKFDGVEQFFEEYPIATIRDNRIKRMPVLSTMNSHEGALFLQRDGDGNVIIEKDLQYFIPRYTGIQHNTPNAGAFVKQFRDFYFEGREGVDEDKYIDFISDALFTRDVVMLAEFLSKYIDDSYICIFSYSGNLSTSVMKKLGRKGATHGDLVQYLFYKENKAAKCSEKDQKIVDILSEAWCNFAKSGKPSWRNEEVKWLPYDQYNKYTLHVDDNINLVPNPYRGIYSFWTKLTGERSKL